MTTDWHTWIGKGDTKDFLDPANWKDGKVPPKRDGRMRVPNETPFNKWPVIPADTTIEMLCVT